MSSMKFRLGGRAAFAKNRNPSERIVPESVALAY